MSPARLADDKPLQGMPANEVITMLEGGDCHAALHQGVMVYGRSPPKEDR